MGEILNNKIFNLLKRSDKVTKDINLNELDYILTKINRSSQFAKLYLTVCKSIHNNNIKFIATKVNSNITKRTIYRFFNYLVDLRYFSINKLSGVTTFILIKPVDEFITLKRLDAANKKLEVHNE